MAESMFKGGMYVVIDCIPSERPREWTDKKTGDVRHYCNVAWYGGSFDIQVAENQVSKFVHDRPIRIRLCARKMDGVRGGVQVYGVPAAVTPLDPSTTTAGES